MRIVFERPTMKIVFERPPMFNEINERFKIAGTSVIFAWGKVIYNPSKVTIPPQLIAHEKVHGIRQRNLLICDSVEDWWRRYIDDPVFRLTEELPAHRAEYEALLRPDANRNLRRSALKKTAQRLAAPLYGRMVTQREAQTLLKAA